MRLSIQISILIVSAAIGGSMAPAAVTQRSSGNAGPIDDIIKCHAITGTDERLACYDRHVTALAASRQSAASPPSNREDVAQRQRQQFGLSQPAIATIERQTTTAPEIAKLDLIVDRAVVSGRDRLTLYLADGSVWQTLERTPLAPRAGDRINIRRGALDSYLGSYQGRSIRMRRLR